MSEWLCKELLIRKARSEMRTEECYCHDAYLQHRPLSSPGLRILLGRAGRSTCWSCSELNSAVRQKAVWLHNR